MDYFGNTSQFELGIDAKFWKDDRQHALANARSSVTAWNRRKRIAAGGMVIAAVALVVAFVVVGHFLDQAKPVYFREMRFPDDWNW